jgi:hypothetical protein
MVYVVARSAEQNLVRALGMICRMTQANILWDLDLNDAVYCWVHMQAVQGYRATAEGQAAAAKKEAEQLRERSSVSQAAQQQLLAQLAAAEEALSSSSLTSSRLLQEGQRLEAQVMVYDSDLFNHDTVLGHEWRDFVVRRRHHYMET